MHETEITRDTLLEWIERWGESYDDIRPGDPMSVANRVVEYNDAEQAVESAADPNAVYRNLASIIEPAMRSMDGFFPAGSRWLAGEVERLEYEPAEEGADSDASGREGTVADMLGTSFMVRAEASADDRDGPSLDTVVTAASNEYLNSGMDADGFSDYVRSTWRDAAAYDWMRMMEEPRSPGEWSNDSARLAVLAVMMRFAPESTAMMIASDVLDPNAPLPLDRLRGLINTRDDLVDTDRLFDRLIDPSEPADPKRIAMAMGILDPVEANAPTEVGYRIAGLKSMLLLAAGDELNARRLAEESIGYDASDRYASSTLDRLPEAGNPDEAGATAAACAAEPQGRHAPHLRGPRPTMITPAQQRARP
ncbi:hypothetical protein BISA_2244 [Bifidobacterium saguini DSM 23967]|uniref:Uncharacterized protein n=2 Tax=Bifidobacterium saguini TaxID=762210 RepID=A0A087D5S0_9BIFI|nr:hypothetical protein BISA_2244 [Bifidobacterium saguini DSM 23967]